MVKHSAEKLAASTGAAEPGRRTQANSSAVQTLPSANHSVPDPAGALPGWKKERAGRGPDAAAARDPGARGGVLGEFCGPGRGPVRPCGRERREEGVPAPQPPRVHWATPPSLGPHQHHLLLLHRARAPSPVAPRPALCWEPLIGRGRGLSPSSQGADWTYGFRAAPSLLRLVCCALAQRKRRPGEGAPLLWLDCRGGGGRSVGCWEAGSGGSSGCCGWERVGLARPWSATAAPPPPPPRRLESQRPGGRMGGGGSRCGARRAARRRPPSGPGLGPRPQLPRRA